MPNNKNPQDRQPGEKPAGKFHYNPGNMSGKKIGTTEEDNKDQERADKKQGQPEDRERNH
jgi:hypothetical protein